MLDLKPPRECYPGGSVYSVQMKNGLALPSWMKLKGLVLVGVPPETANGVIYELTLTVTQNGLYPMTKDSSIKVIANTVPAIKIRLESPSKFLDSKNDIYTVPEGKEVQAQIKFTPIRNAYYRLVQADDSPLPATLSYDNTTHKIVGTFDGKYILLKLQISDNPSISFVHAKYFAIRKNSPPAMIKKNIIVTEKGTFSLNLSEVT